MSEIDALRELSELKASLSYDFWDNAAYVALCAVFIGVVGEFFVELTNWPSDTVWKAKLGKASVLILIAGLGGDIVTYAKNSAINGTIIGFLHKKAGDAYQLAGEANERASEADERAGKAIKDAAEAQERAASAEKSAGEANEHAALINEQSKILEQDTEVLKKENIVLNAKLRGIDIRTGDREMNAEERANLKRALRGRKHEITVVMVNDREPHKFALVLVSALGEAGVVPRTEDAKSSPETDVIVCVKNREDQRVVNALKSAHIVTVPLNQKEGKWPAFCDHAPGTDIFTSVERGTVVFVGQHVPITVPAQ